MNQSFRASLYTTALCILIATAYYQVWQDRQGTKTHSAVLSDTQQRSPGELPFATGDHHTAGHEHSFSRPMTDSK
ncbi:MAG: hypothetical protein C9356_00785 [Oleiphilus sp.]|nr:MAG: hypothetical protein C9356_00785 [Oleiphilus sp.]